MEEKKSAAIHKLMLERQKGGTITGIRDVISFDEKEILLHTEDGKLSIKGETLHVKHLDLEHGELSLEGRIDSLAYLGRKKEKQEESLIKRLFHERQKKTVNWLIFFCRSCKIWMYKLITGKENQKR